METEIMKAVVTEILEELREIKQTGFEQRNAASELKAKIESLKAELVRQKGSSANEGRTAIEAAITKGISQLKSILATEPKNVVPQKRILFFPEQGAEEYYRLVVGRLLFWLLAFVIASYLFSLGKQMIQTWQEVKEKEYEKTVYKAAWQTFYKAENKTSKKKMDSVIQKAVDSLSR